jgi:hypothetical protein
MKASIQELVHAPQADYVETFQSLAIVNMEIQKMGPTPERLLCRGLLEIDMGAYVDARESIQDALIANSGIAEGMYYLGVANVLLCLQRAGVIAGSAGQLAPEPARVHMEQACSAFRSALALNSDEDLQSQLTACEDLLAEAEGEEEFLELF